MVVVVAALMHKGRAEQTEMPPAAVVKEMLVELVGLAAHMVIPVVMVMAGIHMGAEAVVEHQQQAQMEL
jgi:hypothetical protein